MAHRIVLTAEPLDPRELEAGLGGEELGAMVSFSGRVRRSEGDLPLRAIDYEIYEGMARRKIEEFLSEAEERWPEFSAVIAHRSGEVAVGEVSVWIGVSCGHRAEAFELARFFIDELKARVPIWKREHLPAGDALDSGN
ncbi:MAG TPA: molybdenum cofactor biosynthesis protein MoaE [Candidatus Krumholzibacteria bacterium]